VLYVRSDQGRQRLLPLMNDNNRATMASAPAVAVLAFDTAFHEHIPTVLPYKPELKDLFDASPEMREGGRFSAALQVGYFLLAGVDREFFPDGRFKSLLVVNLGHPGENPWLPRLPRLAHEDTVSWD
jgi:3-hydroxypropanoate dehydrogenase